jgi:hypothetical protein
MMEPRFGRVGRALSGAAIAVLLVASPTLAADNQRPQASPPTASIRIGTRLTATPKVHVSWPAATDNVKVVRYQLQQRTNLDPWVPVTLPTRTSLMVDVSLTPGTDDYRFRVRAFDKAGNASLWAPGTTFNLRLREETANSISYAGKWVSEELLGASGGSVMWSTKAGATATLTFTGTDFALATTLGPDRGRAAVFIDSRHVVTVDLYSSSPMAGWIAYGSKLGSGAHVVDIMVLGTNHPVATGKRIDIDAFVILQ